MNPAPPTRYEFDHCYKKCPQQLTAWTASRHPSQGQRTPRAHYAVRRSSPRSPWISDQSPSPNPPLPHIIPPPRPAALSSQIPSLVPSPSTQTFLPTTRREIDPLRQPSPASLLLILAKEVNMPGLGRLMDSFLDDIERFEKKKKKKIVDHD